MNTNTDLIRLTIRIFAMLELVVLLILLKLSNESELARELVAHRLTYRLSSIKEQLPHFQYERLTVKESVGQVFCHGVIGGYQIDPSARDVLHKIIENPNLLRYHKTAIGVLSLEGDRRDLQVCVRYLESCREKELSPLRHIVFRAVFRTVAHLAIREIEGADAVLRRFCTREYWSDLKFMASEGENLDELHDELVFEAVEALAITRCKDLREVIARVVEAVPEGERRHAMRDGLAAKPLDEFVKQHELGIWPLIPRYSRQRAVSKFNGDLQNPGPRDPDE